MTHQAAACLVQTMATWRARHSFGVFQKRENVVLRTWLFKFNPGRQLHVLMGSGQFGSISILLEVCTGSSYAFVLSYFTLIGLFFFYTQIQSTPIFKFSLQGSI